MENKQEKMIYQTTPGERISFGIYGFGMTIFFVLISSFLQQYYLINAAVPASIIGVILLVGKIWDAVNDPMFGVIVDKARLKSGKYLPWMRISTILLPIITTLLFFVPINASVGVKAAFLLIGYILYDATCTMTEVPYFAITTAMTTNPKERSKVISLSKLISVLPLMVILFIPALYTTIGWKPTIIIFAVLAMFSMLPGGFILKERALVRSEKSPRVKELLKYVISNKFLLIFFSSAIIYGLTNTVGTVGNLFAIYNLGGDKMIAPIILISTAPAVLSIIAVNFLINKFDKLQIVLGALAITGITSVIMYFTGYQNMPLFFLLNAIRGFSAGAHTMLFFLFTPDLSEYGTYVTGIRAEGAAFSIQSFASKVIGAISNAIALFILGALGFMEGATFQTIQVQNGLWMLYSIFPVIGATLQATILMAFYRLREKDLLIMIKANQGEISYEDANEQLKGKHPRKIVKVKEQAL